MNDKINNKFNCKKLIISLIYVNTLQNPSFENKWSINQHYSLYFNECHFKKNLVTSFYISNAKCIDLINKFIYSNFFGQLDVINKNINTFQLFF